MLSTWIIPVQEAPAVGPYTIASAGTISTATKRSPGRRLVWDGTRWWAFYQKSAYPARLYYSYSSDLSSWTETYVTLGGTPATDGNAMSIAYDSATNVVIVSYYTDSNYERYMRGAISGTSIAWSNNGNFVYNLTKGSSEYSQRIAIDSAGKVLFQGDDHEANPVVYRSTNSISASFADTGANWSQLGSIGITEAQRNTFIAPLANQHIIVSLLQKSQKRISKNLFRRNLRASRTGF